LSTGAAELLQDSGGTVVDQAAAAPGEIAARSPWQLFWRRLRKDKVALAALAFIVLLVLIAIFAHPLTKLTASASPTPSRRQLLDEFGSRERAERRQLVRDRLARAQRVQPGAGRRGGVAAGRVPVDGDHPRSSA
jgi:hypothetical protein